jgi:tartrate dehydrogenase/decarboxylase/D-malate dehydrogenase
MLDFFGYEAYGKVVLKAIEQLLLEDQVLTPDMNGTASTAEVGDRVTDLISSIISSKDVTVK